MPKQQGQIGLVVLLIMTGMLTLGVSAVSRSTSDLRITRQEAEASQVFNAAEAGIENGLAQVEAGSSSGGSVDVDGIGVDYQISEMREIDNFIRENQVAFVDLTGVNVAGESLQISWASGENCGSDNPASLILSVYNQSGPSANVERFGYAKCDRGDGFAVFGSGSVNFSLNAGDVAVRIRPLYSDTELLVTGAGGLTLPVQYHRIVSTASRSVSDETKVIQLDRSLRAPPSVLDFAVLSGNSLVL